MLGRVSSFFFFLQLVDKSRERFSFAIFAALKQNNRTKTYKDMAEERLFSMKRVSPKAQEMDTVKEAKKFGDRRAFHVLMEAQQFWDNMSRFRKERERNKRYTYGDQWGDIIHVDGEDMTEEEYINGAH